MRRRAVWHAGAVPLHADIVRQLAASGAADQALDLVFDHVEDLLLGARFDECAAILRAVEPTHLPPAVAVGYLAITRTADDQLHDARNDLRERIGLAYRNTMAPDGLEQLLSGL